MAETDATINGVKVQMYEGKADSTRRAEGVVLVAADGSPIHGASAKTSVSNTFTSTANSAAFTPIPGRPFNIRLKGSGWVATMYVESSEDAGATWQEELDMGVSVPLISPGKVALVEHQDGIQYRLRCVWTSGSIPYTIGQ
jgi:hypothetical protein